MIYQGDENSDPPSVESRDVLATIRPHDHHVVHVRQDVDGEDYFYHFDYTSSREPNEVDVLPPGSFPEDHPTHAGQLFMTGHWVRQPRNEAGPEPEPGPQEPDPKEAPTEPAPPPPSDVEVTVEEGSYEDSSPEISVHEDEAPAEPTETPAEPETPPETPPES